jgi:signal transduction histidine kinase
LQQPTVLIVSDDASFPSTVTGRWQSERDVPVFTLMSSDLCHALDPETFDMAIVAGLRQGSFQGVGSSLQTADKPTVLVLEENCSAGELREARTAGIAFRKHESWLDTLLALASEMLQRCDAVERARQAEQASAAAAMEATLGRYMLDVRPNLNNALTSVLGNSELLLERGLLSSSARSQAETIHSMALRMHETLQRFSSLEKELRQSSGVGRQSSAAAR